MNSTSASLLVHLKSAPPSDPEWQRFSDLYLPLIHRWSARLPGVGSEIDDLAQEVLLVVIKELPAFERRRMGSFRAWLKTVAVNRARVFARKQLPRDVAGHDSAAEAFLDQLADPASDLSNEWNRQHDRHVARALLERVKADFDASTWSAFRLLTLEGRSANQVAEEVGISPVAALSAKHRVLRRLRDEAADFLD